MYLSFGVRCPSLSSVAMAIELGHITESRECLFNYMFGGKGNLNNKIMKTSQYQENDEIHNYFNIKLPANGAVVLKKVARK